MCKSLEGLQKTEDQVRGWEKIFRIGMALLVILYIVQLAIVGSLIISYRNCNEFNSREVEDTN